MLRSLKKILFIVPCMIIGLFIFSGTKAMAVDAKLLSGTEIEENVVVGIESKENTYYFSNSTVWELEVFNYNPWFWTLKPDVSVSWRVVRPDGKATSWSEEFMYPDNDGKFNIGDYTKLNYNQDVDVSTRISVAPKMTYYIDLHYYNGRWPFVSHDSSLDETIKVVVNGDDDSLNRPSLDISYNKTSNAFTIETGVPDYGIVTEVNYFFSNDALTLSTTGDFDAEFERSSEHGYLLEMPNDEVTVVLKNSTSSYKYLYVISKTGNGYSTISSYDMTPPSSGNNGGGQQGSNTGSNPNYDPTSSDDGNGVFDLPIGHVILIILVIVLIVSCALIITQKIVDYKKRLY